MLYRILFGQGSVEDDVKSGFAPRGLLTGFPGAIRSRFTMILRSCLELLRCKEGCGKEITPSVLALHSTGERK